MIIMIFIMIIINIIFFITVIIISIFGELYFSTIKTDKLKFSEST